MRDFLNGILTFIGAESLTDLEFESITATIPIYDQDSYDALFSVLDSRESVSILIERLNSYYYAKGAEVNTSTGGKSNIYIGSVLE